MRINVSQQRRIIKEEVRLRKEETSGRLNDEDIKYIEMLDEKASETDVYPKHYLDLGSRTSAEAQVWFPSDDKPFLYTLYAKDPVSQRKEVLHYLYQDGLLDDPSNYKSIEIFINPIRPGGR